MFKISNGENPFFFFLQFLFSLIFNSTDLCISYNVLQSSVICTTSWISWRFKYKCRIVQQKSARDRRSRLQDVWCRCHLWKDVCLFDFLLFWSVISIFLIVLPCIGSRSFQRWISRIPMKWHRLNENQVCNLSCCMWIRIALFCVFGANKTILYDNIHHMKNNLYSYMHTNTIIKVKSEDYL